MSSAILTGGLSTSTSPGSISLVLLDGLSPAPILSIRESIVASIITRLETILTANGYQTNLGNNIFDWKVIDVQEADLPCAIVKDTSEDVETKGGNHLHSLQIEVEAKSPGVDRAIPRKIIADVQKAIGVDPNFDSQVYRTEPVENETLDFEQQNKVFSSIIIKFVVNYATLAFQPYQ